MPKLNESVLAELRRHVLEASRALVAEGAYPGPRELSRRVPGRDPATLMRIRDELRRDGRLAWDTVRVRPDFRKGGMLPCTTPEQRAVIWERARRLRLGLPLDGDGVGDGEGVRS